MGVLIIGVSVGHTLLVDDVIWTLSDGEQLLPFITGVLYLNSPSINGPDCVFSGC